MSPLKTLLCHQLKKDRLAFKCCIKEYIKEPDTDICQVEKTISEYWGWSNHLASIRNRKLHLTGGGFKNKIKGLWFDSTRDSFISWACGKYCRHSIDTKALSNLCCIASVPKRLLNQVNGSLVHGKSNKAQCKMKALKPNIWEVVTVHLPNLSSSEWIALKA